jgi:hypothetical protein
MAVLVAGETKLRLKTKVSAYRLEINLPEEHPKSNVSRSQSGARKIHPYSEKDHRPAVLEFPYADDVATGR